MASEKQSRFFLRHNDRNRQVLLRTIRNRREIRIGKRGATSINHFYLFSLFYLSRKQHRPSTFRTFIEELPDEIFVHIFPDEDDSFFWGSFSCPGIHSESCTCFLYEPPFPRFFYEFDESLDPITIRREILEKCVEFPCLESRLTFV